MWPRLTLYQHKLNSIKQGGGSITATVRLCREHATFSFSSSYGSSTDCLGMTKRMLVASGQCTGWARPSFLWFLQVKIMMAIYHWMGRNVDITNSRYFDVWNPHVYLTNESSFYFCSFVNRLNSALNASWPVNPEGIKIPRFSFCLCSPHHLPQSLVVNSILLLKSRSAHSLKGQPQLSKTFQHRGHKQMTKWLHI